MNTLSICQYILFNISYQNLFLYQKHLLIDCFSYSHHLFPGQCTDIVI